VSGFVPYFGTGDHPPADGAGHGVYGVFWTGKVSDTPAS
jgi:hypothetical protein